VGFSVWSGWDGYPGAGRMPWYLILCKLLASKDYAVVTTQLRQKRRHTKVGLH